MVEHLSNDLVLGMDWLKRWNPVVDWVGCTLSLKLATGSVDVHALPKEQAARVEVCSLDAVTKAVKGGAVAWFGLLRQGDMGLANMELGKGPGVGGLAGSSSH